MSCPDVHAQRPMEPVPPGKYGAEVRVVLPLDLRVVDAVHARSDEHLIEQAFGAERMPNVAVVKKRTYEYLFQRSSLNGSG